MRLFRNLPPAADRPVALTLGNFDGVHVGHQAMLTRVADAAGDLDLVPAALTFDPHPREFFAPGSAPPRLTTLREKAARMAAAGIERVYLARFDARLAGLDAETFIEQILIGRLGIRWILVGEDFRFGKGRRGDIALLRAKGARLRFSVEAMASVNVDAERVSSSAVRAAIAQADFTRAARLLGRAYSICGRVAHGRKLGRTLGFPTLNLPLAGALPLSGVFAVRVHGIGDEPLPGAASVGVRPTLAPQGEPLLEVHLLDYSGDLYGRRIEVEFAHKLRDEEKYPTLEALTAQIRTDVADVRGYFAQRK